MHYCYYSVAGLSLLLLHSDKLVPMPRWIDFDIITIMLINLDRMWLVITGSNFPAKLKHDSLSLILLLPDSFLSFFLWTNQFQFNFFHSVWAIMYILNFGLDSMLHSFFYRTMLHYYYYIIIFLVSMFFFYYTNIVAVARILSRVFIKKHKLHNFISF